MCQHRFEPRMSLEIACSERVSNVAAQCASLGSRGHPPATPLRFPRTGNVSFYMDETGVLRGGYKNGFDADAGDDPFCG